MESTKVTLGAVLMTAATIGGMFLVAVLVALIAMAMQPGVPQAEAKAIQPWNVDKSVDREEVELGSVSVITQDGIKHSFLYLRDDGDLGFWPVGRGWDRDEDVNEAVHGDYGSVKEITILVKLDSGEMRMYDWHPGDSHYQRRM